MRKLLPFLIVTLIRALFRTVRFRVEDRCGITRCPLPPMIWACWHNRLLAVPVAHSRVTPDRPAVVLTSPSKDGAILADAMARFGVGSVRGSSSRRGGVAIRELIGALKEGSDIGITPDGPRGPVYKLAQGVVKLAQLTGAPVMPVHIHYSRYWELKSWDRFRIPKPFSRVEIIFDTLHEVKASADEDETAFEAERARLENLLAGEGR